MTVRNIPAQTVFECDRCGGSGAQYAPGPFRSSGLHIRQAERWSGNGGGKQDFDFCGECAESFDHWRNPPKAAPQEDKP